MMLLEIASNSRCSFSNIMVILSFFAFIKTPITFQQIDAILFSYNQRTYQKSFSSIKRSMPFATDITFL